MGFFFQDGYESEVPEEMMGMLDDIEEQIAFHRNNIVNADLGLVEDVLKRLMISMTDSVDPEIAKGLVRMLTGMFEALIELRATNEVLRSELIEKKVPPPDCFDMN